MPLLIKVNLILPVNKVNIPLDNKVNSLRVSKISRVNI